MAPPSPRTQSNKSTAHNNSDTIDSLTAPSWDTSLASKPLYLDALVRWLQTQDGKYRTLVEYGIVIQKHHTVTTSANHMDRHYHGLIKRGSFREPCMINRLDNDPTGLPMEDSICSCLEERLA